MENNELDRMEGFAVFRAEEPPHRLWAQASSGVRALAVEYDRSNGEEFDLASLWRRLRSCEWRVCDTFATASRLYAIVEKLDGGYRESTRDAGMAMIEQVLLGNSSKAVAIDRQVSDSTVAWAIRKRLRLMGLTCKLRAVPLILAMAARAARAKPPGTLLGRIAQLTDEPASSSWVVSISQPDCRFPSLLSEAENSVLLHVLEGKSYVQIAAARETSMRTVANQLASVFRKLGVSGYGQTLDLLLSRAFDSGSGDTHSRGAGARTRLRVAGSRPQAPSAAPH